MVSQSPISGEKENRGHTWSCVFMRDPAIAAGIAQYGAIQSVAPSFAVELTPVNVQDTGDIERAVSEFGSAPNGGLIVTASAPANHVRARSRGEWLHQQARHMTAPDRKRHHANSALDAGAELDLCAAAGGNPADPCRNYTDLALTANGLKDLRLYTQTAEARATVTRERLVVGLPV